MRSMKGLVSWLLTSMTVVGVASGGASMAQAPAPPVISEPRVHGQWEGPYGLAINDSFAGEIAHAAVLPPPTNDLLKERVILVCHNKVTCNAECTGPNATGIFGRSYIWDHGRPLTNVTALGPPTGYP